MLSRHASFNPPATPENVDKMLGSYTPHYIFHPLVPFNLAAMMPLAARNSMKFVIFLRDPVERAISSFWFKKRTKAETAVAASALRQGMARRRKMEKAVRLALGVSTSRTDVRCIAEASRVSGVTPPSAQRWTAREQTQCSAHSVGVLGGQKRPSLRLKRERSEFIFSLFYRTYI